MVFNIIATIAVLAILGIFLYRFFRHKEGHIEDAEFVYEIKRMVEYIEERMYNLIYTENIAGLSSDDAEDEKNQKAELKKALRTTMHGDPSTKIYVKAHIREKLIEAYEFNNKNINKAIKFDRPQDLTSQDKFEILLHLFMRKYGRNGFSNLIKKYKWDELRPIPNEITPGYMVTKQDLEEAFDVEDINLSLDDKIDIITQRVYQLYKGLGSTDLIIDQNIDGVNGGSSGLPPEVVDDLEMSDYRYGQYETPKAYEGVWIFYKGKSLSLNFLSFGTQEELVRVCMNVYTHRSPGQLNESRGYVINERANGSRLVVLRPPFTESWGFFCRNFDASLAQIDELFKTQEGLDEDGREIIIDALDFIAKGQQTMAFTGQQGAGKTVLMKAVVAFIPFEFNLRIQEGSSFELWLRKAYPFRNIFTFRETDRQDGAEGLVVQKKTDGAVNLVGEVAADPVAAWVMKAGEVASLFTWFTHHARTLAGLVYAMRDALVATGQFSNEVLAEQHVARVIKFNTHLMNKRGHRFTQRITECVPLTDAQQYDFDFDNKNDMPSLFKEFSKLFKEYATRSTDRKNFVANDVIIYKDGRYQPANCFTPKRIEEMMNNMTEEDAKRFSDFLAKHWGYEYNAS
jgi:pilus assembly protein CpaF